MATKNFLYIVSLSLISAFFISCQTAERPKRPNEPVIIKTPTVPEVAHPPAQQAQVPEFVAQRTSRVGIIFGPGGAKTFAHIGVLQELERYKMPIVAVAGLEWGALVGSLYALNGQSHEVDWKMSKLPKQSFSSKNLFSKKMTPASTPDYDKYLEQSFQNTKLDSTKLPFVCPYVRGASGKTTLLRSGLAKNSLRACWYYPPLFELKENMAAPFAVADAADALRKQGAELIILIDVLGSADKKDFTEWSDDVLSWLSWVPVQNSMSSARLMGVHEIIKVDTSAFSMYDMDQRLRLIQVGKQGAASTIDRLAKKYDF